MKLDSMYGLYHKEHPPSPLFFFRLDYKNIDRNVLDYYADCLAFLHDQPTMIIDERDHTVGGRPVLSGRLAKSRSYSLYYDSVYQIYQRILDMRIDGSVLFFSEEALLPSNKTTIVDIGYFRKVKKELRLYNAALKQSEPYIEFFMYCRVIECICNGLNTQWIRKRIEHVADATFYPVYVFQNRKDITEKNKVDYIGLLKKRFAKRIDAIKEKGIDIGTYYLDEIRNSIAHGKTTVIEYSDTDDVAEDCIVMRLLSRYGIQAKYLSETTSKQSN